jgi:arabinofuranan 3-O-arabinosyltransferase
VTATDLREPEPEGTARHGLGHRRGSGPGGRAPLWLRPSAWRRQAGRLGWPRAGLLACCLLLIGLPFATAPGGIIADTKFELAVNPALFLHQALQLWNAQQFGGLTDQYVGFLFPMGPFFELLKLAGSAGWLSQRVWLGALLLTSFAGTVLLARRLQVGTPGTRLAAGLAYALSPAALSIAGQTSSELLPMVMAPWIIIPLTDMRPWTEKGWRGQVHRSRAVARSALAIALCGGVNAASTLAIMVPCALYILARPGTRVKARMLAWWLPAVVLVSVSWSVPLVLLSKYGVSIVLYTESAQVTTTTTSLLAILRGVENWIGYQSTNGQPDRPLAFLLGTTVVPSLLTGLLAALGLAGLARRGMPHRRLLLVMVLGGVVIMSLGYVSSLGNPLEGPLTGLLNGVASAFRNVWKFDPVVRLPLALGLAHLLAVRWTARQRALLRAAALVSLASLAVPAATTGLASPGSFAQVPPYWVAAANWLNTHAGREAVLVEPGSSFGEYTWGSPMDDVLSALTNVDFAERNLSVVGSVGNERLLNAIDQDITEGDGSAGLTEVMARMGIKYVLVRNDLAASQTTGTYPARVHDALVESPGITLAAQFGPEVGGGTVDDAVNDFDAPYPAVQIYHVSDSQAAAVVQPAAGTLRVIGAPESLVTLANENLLGNRPVLLNSDGPGQPVASTIVTDSLRQRVVNFGALRQDYSPTLTATEPLDTFLSTNDYTEADWSPDLAYAKYIGIKDVTASSSAAGIQTFPSQWGTGLLPYAAFDSDAKTMWESGAFDGPLGQWIQGDFDSGVPFGPGAGSRIKVAFADSPAVGPPVTRVTVSTAAGSVSDPVRITGDPQYLAVPSGPSSWLRITITGLDPTSTVAAPLGVQVGITSVQVAGVSASRTIVAPPVPAGADSATVVLAKAQPYEPGCMLTSVRWVCNPMLVSPTEEQYGFDQTAVEPAAQRARLSGTAILTDPSLIEHYALDWPGEPVVTATSTQTDDPQDQPWNAFDGNLATTWVANPEDPHPQLSIVWGYNKTISQLTIERPPGASSVMQLVIVGNNGQRRGAIIGASGVATFTRMTTTSVHLILITYQSPIQISDVVIPGVRPVAEPSLPLSLRCGLGPDISVGGKTVPTEVTGTFADLLNGTPLQFTACKPVTLAAGDTRVTEPASDAFDVQDVVLKPAPAASPASATASSATTSASSATTSSATTSPATTSASPGTASPGATSALADQPVAATVVSWTSSKRVLSVTAPTRSYLEVNENFNLGWRAKLDGTTLQPVQLDGWKQAWVLPAGAQGQVTLSYAPARTYRDSIIAGAIIVALCFLLSLALPRRRRRRRPLLWPGQSPAAGRFRRVASGAEPAAEGGRGRRGRPPWWSFPAGLAMLAVLAGVGVLIGGYPGAIVLPVATVILLWMPGAGSRARPLLIGGLFVVAAVAGAIGENLVYSGDTGPVVTLASNGIPQVACLLVIAGLIAAGLARPGPETEDGPRPEAEDGAS